MRSNAAGVLVAIAIVLAAAIGFIIPASTGDNGRSIPKPSAGSMPTSSAVGPMTPEGKKGTSSSVVVYSPTSAVPTFSPSSTTSSRPVISNSPAVISTNTQIAVSTNPPPSTQTGTPSRLPSTATPSQAPSTATPSQTSTSVSKNTPKPN